MSSSRAPQPTVRVSVFVKLVSVMLAMAISLLFLVFWFFAMLVGPSVTVSNQLLEEFAQAFVASAPDLAEARRVSRRLHVEIRYEPQKLARKLAGKLAGKRAAKLAWKLAGMPPRTAAAVTRARKRNAAGRPSTRCPRVRSCCGTVPAG